MKRRVNHAYDHPCYTALGYESYADYLRSDHWQSVKTMVRRTKRNCDGCSSVNSRMIVHHNTYRNLGHENLADLNYLCEGCHSHIHDYHRKHGNLTLKQATATILQRYKRYRVPAVVNERKSKWRKCWR